MNIAIHCAHDEIADLSALKPNPGNPNKHPPEQITLLSKIIRIHGWRNPIVVSNRSGLITKGHARFEAALKLGLKSAPVDRQDYESEKEELADMIADNRIAELADPDRTMLRELAEYLDDGAFDMDLTGFDSLALEELMTAAPPAEQGKNDPNSEWYGLPAFENDELLNTPFYCLVRFRNEEDRHSFAKFLGWRLNHNGKVWSTWFPKPDFDQYGTKEGIAYGDES